MLSPAVTAKNNPTFGPVFTQLTIMKRILVSVIMTAITCTALNAQDSSALQYVGKYKFPEGSIVAGVEVAMNNGALVMSSSAGVSDLGLLGVDSFNIVNFNGYAVFKRNEAKKIVGVHIEASGYILDGPKESAMANISVQSRKAAPASLICLPERIYNNREEAQKAISARRAAKSYRDPERYSL
jgi:hypothetical protein